MKLPKFNIMQVLSLFVFLLFMGVFAIVAFFSYVKPSYSTGFSISKVHRMRLQSSIRAPDPEASVAELKMSPRYCDCRRGTSAADWAHFQFRGHASGSGALSIRDQLQESVFDKEKVSKNQRSPPPLLEGLRSYKVKTLYDCNLPHITNQ